MILLGETQLVVGLLFSRGVNGEDGQTAQRKWLYSPHSARYPAQARFDAEAEHGGDIVVDGSGRIRLARSDYAAGQGHACPGRSAGFHSGAGTDGVTHTDNQTRQDGGSLKH